MKKYIIIVMAALSFVSCEDFLTPDSDHHLYSDESHLTNATDTVYSMMGIINKLQAIADRTVLFGELRGDLVDINNNTPADLRKMALFQFSDSNAYNAPLDYYAVINNCNYYIANADLTLKNSRDDYIFRNEYVMAKTFRAWTYMQLALIYGSVPFVTEPITSESLALKDYPKYNLDQICEYFINDLSQYANFNSTTTLPNYGAVIGVDTRLFFIPVLPLLGDLYLWAAKNNDSYYRKAAECYGKYIYERQLTTSYSSARISWPRDVTNYQQSMMEISNRYTTVFSSSEESSYNNSEIISLIPMDSLEADGNYSQLNSLFNSTEKNNYVAYLTPSKALINLSAAQDYCNYSTGNTITYAQKGLDDHADGDLRLHSIWQTMNLPFNGQRIEIQFINKFHSSGHIHLMRRADIWLHLAEALNRAGFPEVAYSILAEGINRESVASIGVASGYSQADSLWLATNLNFSATQFVIDNSQNSQNMVGIHGRGCGYTQYDSLYKARAFGGINGVPAYDHDTAIKNVEDMIVEESALENAFEGKRFYDLMRVAKRRNDNTYLSSRVYARGGEDMEASHSGIQADLTNERNWYVSWQGKIGF